MMVIKKSIFYTWLVVVDIEMENKRVLSFLALTFAVCLAIVVAGCYFLYVDHDVSDSIDFIATSEMPKWKQSLAHLDPSRRVQ